MCSRQLHAWNNKACFYIQLCSKLNPFPRILKNKEAALKEFFSKMAVIVNISLYFYLIQLLWTCYLKAAMANLWFITWESNLANAAVKNYKYMHEIFLIHLFQHNLSVLWEQHKMVIQAWPEPDTTISNSKVTLKALSSFVELRLKVSCKRVKMQQLRFDYLFSQCRIMLILFLALKITQSECHQCHIVP